MEFDVIAALRGLVVGDAPEAWAAIGFTVGDDRCVVDGVTVHLVGDDGPRGILAWTLDHPAPRSVDGLVHDDVGRPGSPAVHRNGAVLVDHVVATSPDVDRTTAALAQLGLEPRRTLEGERDGRRTVFRFFVLSNGLLELIGPAEPAGSGRPARFRGVAFVTEDLEATVATLGERCGRPHDAVQPGRRIASLRTDAADVSVPLAFMTPRPAPPRDAAGIVSPVR